MAERLNRLNTARGSSLWLPLFTSTCAEFVVMFFLVLSTILVYFWRCLLLLLIWGTNGPLFSPLVCPVPVLTVLTCE
jgi:hypothetical protein